MIQELNKMRHKRLRATVPWLEKYETWVCELKTNSQRKFPHFLCFEFISTLNVFQKNTPRPQRTLDNTSYQIIISYWVRLFIKACSEIPPSKKRTIQKPDNRVFLLFFFANQLIDFHIIRVVHWKEFPKRLYEMLN